jgi:Beta-galactosidase/beta-glucuronidase
MIHLVKPIRVVLLTALILNYYQPAIKAQGRITENFNYGWKFHKGDIQGGETLKLNDGEWRNLDLPHDWSIEGPFSKDNFSCTGYLPGGIGWYRKTFKIPVSMKDKKTFICFDGIYNNSEVWINGQSLGKRPNGYITFQYDLTPYLKFGKNNLIAVKVDHSEYGDSRWYTGSGIYRDVQLVITDPVHIKQWGVSYSTSDVSMQKALVDINVSLVNETQTDESGELANYLLFGKDTVGLDVRKITIDKASDKVFSQKITVSNPRLWDVNDPALYSLITVFRSRRASDKITTNVGIRTIKFDPDKGFFLNGKSMKLKGICMHHDAGTLGSAVPKEEISRRLDILKEMGCNAIRTSHNPFSPDFLDLCDIKGFLVIGEAFDEWELPKKKWLAGWNVGTPGKEGYSVNFKEWGMHDLSDFIMRDRNHPSVIMWSIGNEIDYPNDPYTHQILNTEANPQTWAKFSESLPHADRLGEIARELVSLIKTIDKTRPVTAGLASALMSNETGYADALDVAGYNYQEFRYASDHKKYPMRPLYGSENGMTLEMWNYVADNDYIMGQFLWTGFEYIGEAGRFPMRSNTAGVIDLAGNKKPEFYFRQSLWSEKPMVFIGTTDRLTDREPVSLWAHKRVDPVWNWEDGKVISVNAFTNCEEVELFLNSRSLGSKKMSESTNRTLTWEVPFAKGTLSAVAKNKGVMVANAELKTTGAISAIIASCDKKSIKADKQAIAHIYLTLSDEAGNDVYTAENEVTCEVTGPARLLGMEDSNPSNIEDYKDNKQKAYHGKLLIYLQATDKPGTVTVKLSSPGLKDVFIDLDIRN